MKHIPLMLSTAMLLLGACGGNNSEINFSGQIGGVESDTILVYISDASTGQGWHVDTIPLVNGYFETTIADTSLLELSIAAKRPYNEKGPQLIADMFYFFPGDKMHLEGTVPYGLVASGTEVYDGLAEYDDYVKVTKAISATDYQLEMLAENESEKEDSLFAVNDRLMDSLNVIKLKIIKEHPNTNMAGFLSLDLAASMGVQAMKILSKEVKQGIMSQCITDVEDGYQREMEVVEAAEAIQPGCPAPNFKLSNLDGKDIALTDFRGKYVVLDFWGSWCGWCIAGIPQMKQYYAKYSKQVEFVGICAFDTDEKWRAAVAKHKIPWVNVLDTEATDVIKTYGVSGFPTKIIVNPEGKIVAVFDGESEEFYEKMDELFQ